MRLVLLAATVSVVLVGATFACSSSSPAEETADAGKDSGKKPVEETPPIEEEPPPVEEEPPPQEDLDGGADDAEAGAPNNTDGGTACLGDSLKEAEPNNDANTATSVTPPGRTFSICGTTSGADPDFFTFKTPAYGQTFVLCQGAAGPCVGAVQISGTIDGQAFNGFNFNGINVNDGSTWVVRVAPSGGGGGGGGGRNYRLTWHFNN
ncbi:MAG: hypothetical protein KIT84_41505 [Labilithrix sp.]|nr:hypothetical protein [Labilithrix sp.]MCW5817549.1 hypothetical protein [Labilithrix sp.]